MEKDLIRSVYLKFKKDSGNNTFLCFEFLNWLHTEMNQLHYLIGMSSLSEIENSYIAQLLQNKN